MTSLFNAFVRPRLSHAAAVVALVVALGGCAAGDRQAPSDTAPTTTATSDATVPDSAADTTDDAEPAEDESPEPVDQQVDVGAVVAGVSATVSGEDSAEVTFRREGEFAVVVHLDCSACTGPTEITAPGRGTPLGAADGPLTGAYLVDVFEGGEAEQSVVIRAAGAWKVTVQSWNDLEPVRGERDGTGSTVLFLGDEASGLTVTYEPEGDGDRFAARYFGVSGDSRVFGADEPFTETYDVELPGVLAITTNGAWSVVPVP